ncbi:MAG: hypothetical protein JW953_04245, partial [Anaerolineae bacterium]|nr:hypothetical protein [Anaerolineae bacterium]
MLPSFDKLTRMLIQERRLEYKNKAVMGGLEKFAPNWVTEAQQEATTAAERQLIEDVAQKLYRYPDIPETDRPNFVHRLLVKLHKSGEQATAETETAADKDKPTPTQQQPEPDMSQEVAPARESSVEITEKPVSPQPETEASAESAP